MRFMKHTCFSIYRKRNKKLLNHYEHVHFYIIETHPYRNNLLKELNLNSSLFKNVAKSSFYNSITKKKEIYSKIYNSYQYSKNKIFRLLEFIFRRSLLTDYPRTRIVAIASLSL